MDASSLRDFYKSLTGHGAMPLEPDDPYYVPILESQPEKDPILQLWQRIEWAESESVNLLTGFRGNGKSTELKRLKRMLEQSGCKVFLVNMLDYIMMTKPLELSDFVLSLMAALAAKAEELGLTDVSESYWKRLLNFLQSDVEIETLGLEYKSGRAAAKLGMRLKTEPTFKQRIQEQLRGHLTRLIEDAGNFTASLVDAIREKEGDPDKKVVFLVDSVEQLRGVGEDAEQVHQRVVDLFSGQAANLAFPKLHVVYTIPPFLIPLAPNLGRSLGGHPIVVWPNIHVRCRDGQEDHAGLAVMRKIIEQRYPQWRNVFQPVQLDRLAMSAGGDLRDFFRLVRETLIRLQTLIVSRKPAVVEDKLLGQIEEQLRNELLPVAEEDGRWLAHIHRTKEAVLPSTKDLPGLARFLDSNLIMNYLNGQPWYDIHPLLVEEIARFLQDSEHKE